MRIRSSSQQETISWGFLSLKNSYLLTVVHVGHNRPDRLGPPGPGRRVRAVASEMHSLNIDLSGC